MTDLEALKARLRDTARQGVFLAIENERYASPFEAADAIERLEAENAALRTNADTLADLLTRATSEIAAMLVVVGKEHAIEKMTDDYVAAINQHDEAAALKGQSNEG